MISKFLASFIAHISEEMLIDFFRLIVREIALKRKKADFAKAVDDLKKVIDETAHSEMSDAEKNSILADSGRTAIDRLRDN